MRKVQNDFATVSEENGMFTFRFKKGPNMNVEIIRLFSSERTAMAWLKEFTGIEKAV